MYHKSNIEIRTYFAEGKWQCACIFNNDTFPTNRNNEHGETELIVLQKMFLFLIENNIVK